MSDVLLVCTDLIFTSRITSIGKEIGRSIRVVPSATQACSLVTPEVRLVLLDLANPKNTTSEQITKLRESMPPEAKLVAYGSHVEVELLRAAKEAGCDVVMVRSEFVRLLPELLNIENESEPDLQ